MISPLQLARMLQNRCSNIKAAQTVSAIQETLDNNTGRCFYVHDDDGGILRVSIVQYKEPLR